MKKLLCILLSVLMLLPVASLAELDEEELEFEEFDPDNGIPAVEEQALSAGQKIRPQGTGQSAEQARQRRH